MSLAAESPVRSSSSSDDFAAFLNDELDSASSDSSSDEEQENDEEENDIQDQRKKRRKLEALEEVEVLQSSSGFEANEEIIGSSGTFEKNDICPPHPGFFRGLCMRCGQLQEDDGSGVAFGYIHKDLKLGTQEIERLRGADLKNLLREKKLILILDLDHTLLNTTRLIELQAEEEYLLRHADSVEGEPNRSLFKLDSMHLLTKLRPFVHSFLKEASSIFELYIYTMGERHYAIKMAELLDPGKVYFDSKVISQADCTQHQKKGLDVVLGAENMVVILDDTESVWHRHRENLIQMERYNFFASSCVQSGLKSLTQLNKDERESDGALATVLNVLKRAHERFFDPVLGSDISSRDVRQVLKTLRQEVLSGCKIVFSRVFPSQSKGRDQPIWKMAEQLGATCCTEVDSSVTHVVSVDSGTEKSRWALRNEKLLVNPHWVEAANFLWKRQEEKDFPVRNSQKNND